MQTGPNTSCKSTLTKRHLDLSADDVSFEAFDEPWKQEFGGVEPYWGMFDSERNLKDITIPTCA